MIYRKLDIDGDYTMGRGFATVLSGTDAVAQAIKTRLLLWQAEWWEDLEEGLPMMQRILGYRNTQNAADILVKQRIEETTDVVNLISFESTFDERTRAYNCIAEVATRYGTITVSEGVL